MAELNDLPSVQGPVTSPEPSGDTAENTRQLPLKAPKGRRSGASSLIQDAMTRPTADYYLIACSVGLLVLLGIFMVMSASSAYSAMEFGTPYHFITRHLAFLVITIPVTVMASRCSEGVMKVLGWIALIVAIIAQVLVLETPLGVPPEGVSTKGNRNWMYLGTFSLQPSEFAKLGLIIWAAGIFANRRTTINQPMRLFFPYLIGFGVVLGLVLAGGDLGTAVIIGAIMLLLLWFVGAPIWSIVTLIAAAAAGVASLIFSSENRMRRVEAFLNGTDSTGGSDQALNAIYALATGGWWGVGLGRSRAKWGALYDAAQNDYVFAVLGEEMGLFGAIAVIALFMVLGGAGLRVALRSDRMFWRITAAGMTSWIVGQAFINIAMAMKLLPVMGVPLPFISYGGSSLMASLLGVGALLAAARHEPDARRALDARRQLRKKRKRSKTQPVRVTSVVDRKGR